ncbi:hypothetical protein SPBR_04669 [Sporothrix brasiliensis 5110]|uniref:Uncharacterized protein n=1 Tax=Sporothrix brasiliensis 5110 TaxID=1398154 RepID=A0A0C2IK98_9PEZI|nr:uncharacterized protein SPBR_04669 [Sporothrix brasiliensis 5110]KIH87410.1 hypothetical protein SPBR_04669 [Sporothrix brasiliensis 5110]
MVDVADEAVQAMQEQNGSPDLYDKSVGGIQVLMMSLICCWASHIEVFGQLDEARVASHLSMMTRLKTVTAARGRILQDGDKNHGSQIQKGIHYLKSSVKGLIRLQFVVNAPKVDDPLPSRQCPRPTPGDMAALKQLMLVAPVLESLAIVGDPSSHSDGFAGGHIPGGTSDYSASSSRPSGIDFYLPPFRFAAGERLPPLRSLHLWRYDWRCHSADDVSTHWDLSRLRSLVFDGAPLRWFLGTLAMDQLRNLTVLRIEDAEWGLQPSEARQAALMLSLMLTHHIEKLEWLELIGIYTDNLPVAAIRRHQLSLERLVLRHPYGLRSAVDAVTPSVSPVLLLALLKDSDAGPGAEAFAATKDDPGGAGGLCEATEASQNGTTQTTTSEETTIYSDDKEDTGDDSQDDTPSVTTDGTAITPPSDVDEQQNEPSEENTKHGLVEHQNHPHNHEHSLNSHLEPTQSHLVSVEFDMDERHMGPHDEPEIMTRLARLPMVRSISLAVPSVLRNLYCVPKYDVDLHNALQRLLFVLGQRQQRMHEQRNASHGSGQRRSGSLLLPLEQITFFIDGFTPLRRTEPGWDKDRHDTLSGEVDEAATREQETAEAEALRKLMATLVTRVAETTASEQVSQPSESPKLDTAARGSISTPSLVVNPLPEEMPRTSTTESTTETVKMSSTMNDSPTTHGLSFLQPHNPNEVDATPGIAQALMLRSQKIRPQRCIIAELISPAEVPTMSCSRQTDAQNHNPYDSCRLLTYHVYEEFACYADEQSPDLTYYQRRDLRENNLRPRQRMKLPFVVHFEQPANLPPPRWDVLGVPLYM